MEAEAKATMICVDNGRSMIKPMFEEQADAIRFYCTEKLNANPKNVVGIASMSANNLYVAAKPTRNISIIMGAVYGMPIGIGGPLLLSDVVILAEKVWCNYLNKDLKKRIVVFAGGHIYDYTDEAKRLGLWLKKWDIACDAVNFGHQSSDKMELFEALVAAAQNKGNSHILHVKDDIFVSQALSSSPIIPTRVGESIPELKNKQHYLEMPYVSIADLISQSLDLMWEYYDRINPAPEIAQAEYSC